MQQLLEFFHKISHLHDSHYSRNSACSWYCSIHLYFDGPRACGGEEIQQAVACQKQEENTTTLVTNLVPSEFDVDVPLGNHTPQSVIAVTPILHVSCAAHGCRLLSSPIRRFILGSCYFGSSRRDWPKVSMVGFEPTTDPQIRFAY